MRLQHLVDTNVEAAKTLHMSMSLALLPAERRALGLRVIAHYSVLHDNLRKIENAQWQDYNRMANGVHQASTMLIQGRYNEAQFLNRVSHYTLSLADTMRAERVRQSLAMMGAV
ncbi:hypothetical protein J6590_078344 [Homalodisca vitripennis]|nr:hypothetical protein J6590_078344 [Homalodisca vitripennis]